jgi:hypothetical protein
MDTPYFNCFKSFGIFWLPALRLLSTINPIKVYFQASEQSYLTFWRRYVTGAENSSVKLPLELILQEGTVYPE